MNRNINTCMISWCDLEWISSGDVLFTQQVSLSRSRDIFNCTVHLAYPWDYFVCVLLLLKPQVQTSYKGTGERLTRDWLASHMPIWLAYDACIISKPTREERDASLACQGNFLVSSTVVKASHIIQIFNYEYPLFTWLALYSPVSFQVDNTNCIPFKSSKTFCSPFLR